MSTAFPVYPMSLRDDVGLRVGPFASAKISVSFFKMPSLSWLDVMAHRVCFDSAQIITYGHSHLRARYCASLKLATAAKSFVFRLALFSRWRDWNLSPCLPFFLLPLCRLSLSVHLRVESVAARSRLTSCWQDAESGAEAKKNRGDGSKNAPRH